MIFNFFKSKEQRKIALAAEIAELQAEYNELRRYTDIDYTGYVWNYDTLMNLANKLATKKHILENWKD